MVGTRLPQCIVSLHTLETDKDILHSIVKCMSHVKLSGDIGGRDHDGEGFLCFIYFCMEVSFFYPLGVKSVLDLFGIVGFSHEFSLCHIKILLMYDKSPHRIRTMRAIVIPP